MTEYKNIVVVQSNEAGQPTNLLSLGDNDTISDDVLSTGVKDAVSSVPILKGDLTSLSAQVTAIDGVSVTALEDQIDALNVATGTLDGQVTSLFAATGTLDSTITGIQGDVASLYQATGTNADNIQDNFSRFAGIYQSTGTLDGLITGLGAATGTLDGLIAGLGTATGTLDGQVTSLYAATGTLDHTITGIQSDITALYDGTGGLYHDVTALEAGGGGGGIPNPIDEDLDMTGFNILNLDTVKGEQLIFSGGTSVQMRAGWPAINTDATGSVTFVADRVLLRPNPLDSTGLEVNLGKGLLVTDTSSVPVSGHDGTSVDAPVNGAALVLDTEAGLFKYQKIKTINIADGAVGANQIANGSIGDDQIGAITINDHTAIGDIALNRIVGGGNRTFLGRSAATGPNGPMEYMTSSQARAIINDGNQEITGNVGINTAATPTVPLQIEDTGTSDAVYIESSDAGADAGPVITLKRDSASPAAADYLGQLKFKGESSTGTERVYAKITAKIDDPTNGSEDGALEIMNRYNGANQIAVRLKEDSFRLLNGVELHVDGNTGLGTNNPSEKLDVQGNIAVTGTVDGRDIAADGTKLDGIEGAFAVGTTAPTSPSEGDLWYDTTTGVDELFAYDSGRSKWLGVNSFCINAGRTGTIGSDVGHYAIMDNREMNPAVGTKRGFQVPFDCTVVGWAWSAGTDTSGFQHRLARYDDSAGTTTQNVYTYSPAGVYDNWEQLDLDIDFDQRDIIGYSAIVASSPTGTIVNQNLTIVIKRRTS